MGIGKGALLRSWTILALLVILGLGIGVVLGCRPDLGFVLFCFGKTVP